MRFKRGKPPYLRKRDKAVYMRLDVLIALAPLVAFSCIYYGMRPLYVMLHGIISAMLFDGIGNLFLRRPPGWADGTAAVTGGIIAAVMSPAAPYWMPIAAAAFAIFAIKIPFGGAGRNIFNPAAGGLAFITLCFDGRMFTYPAPNTPIGDITQIVTGESLGSLLRSGAATSFKPADLLIGDFPGPIGTVAIAILLACAVYLLFRRSISVFTLLPFLAVCTGYAVLFPRVGTGWENSVMLELCSGYLLFAGIFIVTDPVTSPKFWLGRIFYGAAGGILVMLMRTAGRFEEGCCFAILILNTFAPAFDRLSWKAIYRTRTYWQRLKGVRK
ncbi:MAG: RnfABCDGE type electron transport complex subunit D [Oscillospiraceae bacterium]|nr:RnfABCDGE type electron transport complex subunit D [Oscillospiraceae bacterium]